MKQPVELPDGTIMIKLLKPSYCMRDDEPVEFPVGSILAYKKDDAARIVKLGIGVYVEGKSRTIH